MRLVLDTNAVVSALLWGGAPRLLVVAAREGRVEIFTSTLLLAELTDILGRPRFEKKVSASGLPIRSDFGSVRGTGRSGAAG